MIVKTENKIYSIYCNEIYNHGNCDFNELLNKIIVKIEYSDDHIDFFIDENNGYRLVHDQSCCETVVIEDICGDLEDLLNNPILQAEESSNNDHSKGEFCCSNQYNTWTFYIISTIEGSVTIRWHGSSNGFYSEKVDFFKITKIEENDK